MVLLLESSSCTSFDNPMQHEDPSFNKVHCVSVACSHPVLFLGISIIANKWGCSQRFRELLAWL